ncbi:uncharacterized protein LOC141621817 [Silene latifolia]|uniref:uncharacterized protein LOC141621817 n=1 Tax=Silene latifolia TaxID=37657 RepID=UPI003D78360F
MASQQQRRDNTTHEREMHVEKDIVPKRATKFEELAKASDAAAGKEGSAVGVGVQYTGRHQGDEEVKSKRHLEWVEGKMGGLEVGGRNVGKFEEEEGQRKSRAGMEEHGQHKYQLPSDQAAHLIAEQRYAQSKQHGAGTRTREEHHQEKHQTPPSLEQVTQYRQTAQQNSMDAIRAAEERYAKAKEEAANAAYAAKESAKHGHGSAAAITRDRVGATTQYLSEELAPVKETLSSAGQKTKAGTQRASEYASEKAVQAKDTTVSTTKSVAGYVGEKAAVAKDVAVEKAAVAAGYAGKVAEGVKDQAVVAGWGVAHKTTEIAVEATKMAGSVVGKTKDVVASAAHKAAELAEVPVVMAKDTAVDAGEKLADYTARKKMEAERYKEEKQLQYYAQEGTHATSGGGVGEKMQEATETVKDIGRGIMGGSEEMRESEPGVLGAIGETIVEIAQQTSQLVAGPGMQTQVKEKDWPKST